MDTSYRKHVSVLGSTLGSPYLGKLPNSDKAPNYFFLLRKFGSQGSLNPIIQQLNQLHVEAVDMQDLPAITLKGVGSRVVGL